MDSKEYRKLVRRLAKENNLEIGKSWTDYLGGMCTNRHLPDRTITMEVFGKPSALEMFWEELTVYCALVTGKKPRFTEKGYLKFNTNIANLPKWLR